MIAFLKGAILGAILTFIVAYVIGSGGSTAGILNVQGYVVEGFQFWWSWALFLVTTGIAFGILVMME